MSENFHKAMIFLVRSTFSYFLLLIYFYFEASLILFIISGRNRVLHHNHHGLGWNGISHENYREKGIVKN